MSTRQIKDSYRKSSRLRKLSRDAYLALPHVYCIADDFGCFVLDPISNRNEVFPGRADITAEEFSLWITEWRRTKQLEVWVQEGVKYGFFTGWFKHNRLRAEKSPVSPCPPSLKKIVGSESWAGMADKTLELLRQLAADSGRRRRKGSEVKRSEAKRREGGGVPKSDKEYELAIMNKGRKKGGVI